MGALMNLMQSDSTDVRYQMLHVSRKHFGMGGKKRIKFTMVPLLFGALKLVQDVRKLEIEYHAAARGGGRG